MSEEEERRKRFHTAIGHMPFRVRHSVAGKEVVEDEVLRGACDHATVSPCEVQISPGLLLDKVMSVFDSVALDEPPRPKTHGFQGRLNVCRKCGKHEQHDVHELPPKPPPSPPPPPPPLPGRAPPPTSEVKIVDGNPGLSIVGIDLAKDPDKFVVTVICPCGSRATISSRTMTVAELSFIEDWTKAHDGHGEGAGH